MAHGPRIAASPSHGGRLVTGVRIGAGAQVTGDEPGRGLPVSGSQYILANPSPTTPAAGPKVGLVRTAQGLVVSGTTVRNKVAITGDEFGEHLPITGEADQKVDDDLTPRRDDSYRAAQFPRRTDPHGASAVRGRRPGAATSSGDGSLPPLETSEGGLGITGTAVGRSGRVTGNEAGSCRPLTGDQYQGRSAGSSECGGTGGGTAPAAHLGRPRLDPVTGGKVTESQTWRGQRVTGPDVEHRSNATGDESGASRTVTGTAYQGPSSASDRCEPDGDRADALRAESRPENPAVTGDVPMYDETVTGIERGRRSSVTGTPYHHDMRAAEPGDGSEVHAFPVALARPGVRRQADTTPQDSSGDEPASSVLGQITGSFAIAQGKVTGNNEFLPRPRSDRGGRQPVVSGEGSAEGRVITGSAWTPNDRVTGTEGYIAAGRNPSEGGGGSHGWAGAVKFREQGVTETPRKHVTGHSGSSERAGAKVTLSGGAPA